MGVLAVLIAISLIAVVIAPPTLSAQDILDWARLDSPDAGLGLGGNWPWVVFLALDFSAAVCVLVSLYCAFRDESPGWFGFGVWMFAAMTAYANWSFNSVPGAPGDGVWFFPLMSVVGPVMLHWMIKKIRSWTRESAGGKRGSRPKFGLSDWMPMSGSPQATFGAWRVGGMLGISVPDDALFVYRALTRDRGWWRRWAVNSVVRASVYEALDRQLGVGGMHPRLEALLVPAIDGEWTDGTPDDGGDTDDRPPSRDPLDDLENDLLGVPLGTPTSRSRRPAPVSGPPASRVPRPPVMTGQGTGDTGRGDTDGWGRTRPQVSPTGRPQLGTRDGGDTGHGTGDAGGDTDRFDPDLLRYADYILTITEACPDWQSKIPGIRPTARIIDEDWKRRGRSAKPGGEPGFNSRSTVERVLDVMNRLAVQPGITQQIDELRATQTTDQ